MDSTRPRDNQGQDDGAAAAQAAEAIAIAHAQTAELRRQTPELVRDLRRLVEYELSRRVNMGQIETDDITRDEIIDTVFAMAMTRLNDGHTINNLNNYLRDRARDLIQREVRRIQTERRQFVSLEAPAFTGDGEGDEIITVGDMIEDGNLVTPEDGAINNEAMNFLIETLSDVPDLWRHIFLQRTLEGRSPRDIAQREGLDIDEVRRITVRTRDFLRDRWTSEYDEFDDLLDLAE